MPLVLIYPYCRRHLKLPSDEKDLTKLSDENLQWNLGMLEEALPNALSVTVQYCIKHGTTLNMKASDIYRLFPDKAALKSFWSYLAAPFYRKMQTERIYFTEDGKGDWVDHKVAKVLARNEPTNDVITKILKSTSTWSYLTIPPQHILDAVGQCSPSQVFPD